ncbi:hypothetical protein HDV03_005038 [Kappamyces sp. JEL0829]|nr:hypothetical protein HDV03_005038 [Kappamyces sp. JEL0829]
MSIQVTLDAPTLITDAIQDVRNDATATNWVLIGHKDENPNVLTLVAKGNDGYQGLASRLDPKQVLYALLRVTTRVDLSDTIKFVYVHWSGESVGFAKKGKYGVVHGAVHKYFLPYHVDFDITELREMTESMVIDKVQQNVRSADFAVGKPEFGKYQNQKTASQAALAKAGSTGSLDKLNDKASPLKGPGSQSNLAGPAGNVATQSFGATLHPAFLDAIKEVRNDKSSIKWCAGSFQDGNIKNPIVLVGTGQNGSVEDLKPHWSPGSFVWAILRVTDLVDGHPTTKFVAKVATYKGSIAEKMAPYHVDFTVSEHRDINDLLIKDKVSAASGSKINVR